MADSTRYSNRLLQKVLPYLDKPYTLELGPTSHFHPLSMSKPKPRKVKHKPRPPPAPGRRRDPPEPPPPQKSSTDNSSSPSTPTDQRPQGNRKGKTEDEAGGVANKVGEVVPGALPNSGMQVPGATLPEDEEKSSLKIKIHLNIHAKVRLDLDAQIYGDVVIGLL